MNKEITTIKISKELAEKLSKSKIHPRQAYEEVILHLLNSYNGSKVQAIWESKGPVTTIKISKKTAARLSSLKIHPRQSYEEVILRLLNEK